MSAYRLEKCTDYNLITACAPLHRFYLPTYFPRTIGAIVFNHTNANSKLQKANKSRLKLDTLCSFTLKNVIEVKAFDRNASFYLNVQFAIAMTTENSLLKHKYLLFFWI